VNNGDVIVIGAGSVGANVAYRLAARGARVTVLEAGAPGGGTSGVSFAWTNSFNKTPRDYHDLNTAGMAEHRGLVQELGGGAWHPQEGAIAWEEAPAARAHLKETVERLSSWGYPVELISPQEARALEPDLHIAPHVDEVVLTKSEGYVEVVPLIGALLAHAVRLGARVLAGQRVTGVVREGARVRGVTTAGGDRFEADAVVDCAGPATDEVARLAGIEIPFDRVPGRLIYTTPVASTLRRPIHAPGVHFRPDGAGRIVLAEGAHDHVWREQASGHAAWPAEQSLRAVSAHFPALAGARVEATRIGVRPMPKDERPMVGAIPGLDGFYVVTSHSAVTLGPLWGRIVAAELLDGVADPRLAPYRPARFLR
jgi:glycine/D-amino acid oxidase-like deaminating enzyme